MEDLKYIRKHLWLKNTEAGFGCLCLRECMNNLLPKCNKAKREMSLVSMLLVSLHKISIQNKTKKLKSKYCFGENTASNIQI